MIAFGHPAETVWDYSPRQMLAFLDLAQRRQRRAAGQQLSLDRLAAHGDADAVSKVLKQLSR